LLISVRGTFGRAGLSHCSRYPHRTGWPQNTSWNSLFEQFDQLFPSNIGFVSVSAVGFSSEMDQAPVHIDHWRCGLCGGGGWLLLKKRAEAWVFEAEYQIWAS
jgi:hypothetical protein